MINATNPEAVFRRSRTEESALEPLSMRRVTFSCWLAPPDFDLVLMPRSNPVWVEMRMNRAIGGRV